MITHSTTVESKTKTNIEYTIRYVQESDDKNLNDFINELSREKTYITYQGEVVSIEEEREYVSAQLDKIAKGAAVQLVVEVNGAIIGNGQINLKLRVEDHVGVLSISILKQYRGLGIGRTLMTALIDEAKQNLIGMRIIELGVFATNHAARKMYESFGFRKFGCLPEGIKHEGTFVDHLMMFKKV
jgi:ribosomal protein S18 acetylase RimI-like enzyme